MKRAIQIVLVFVLALIVSIVGLALLPTYLVTAGVTVSPEASAKLFVKSYLAWRERVSYQTPEEAKKNLEQQIIRVEVAGRKYNIPMRYTYGSNFEKYGRWPTAKAERIKTQSVAISVLLPDMKPYFAEDEARWKARGFGERVEVAISNSSRYSDWYLNFREQYFSGQKNKFYERKAEENGLIMFARKKGGDNEYFPVGNNPELVLKCTKEPARAGINPFCFVVSNYLSNSRLEYSYGKDYLSRWQEIDSKLKTLVDQFEQAAQSEQP